MLRILASSVKMAIGIIGALAAIANFLN